MGAEETSRYLLKRVRRGEGAEQENTGDSHGKEMRREIVADVEAPKVIDVSLH